MSASAWVSRLHEQPFFVFFFGTFSNVVVPRDCMNIVCRPPCDRPCAIAAAASIAVTVPAVQTRWWWFFQGLLLVGAALMSPCMLKPAGGGHQMAAACWCEYRVPAWISLTAAASIAVVFKGRCLGDVVFKGLCLVCVPWRRLERDTLSLRDTVWFMYRDVIFKKHCQGDVVFKGHCLVYVP